MENTDELILEEVDKRYQKRIKRKRNIRIVICALMVLLILAEISYVLKIENDYERRGTTLITMARELYWAAKNIVDKNEDIIVFSKSELDEVNSTFPEYADKIRAESVIIDENTHEITQVMCVYKEQNVAVYSFDVENRVGAWDVLEMDEYTDLIKCARSLYVELQVVVSEKYSSGAYKNISGNYIELDEKDFNEALERCGFENDEVKYLYAKITNKDMRELSLVSGKVVQIKANIKGHTFIYDIDYDIDFDGDRWKILN